MYCPECGGENNDDAKFCKHCGEDLEPLESETTLNKKNKHIIIISILIAVIIIIGAAIYLTTNTTSNEDTLTLKTYDFGNFTMLVPEEATFKEYDSVGKGTEYWAIGYSSDNSNLYTVWIGNYNGTGPELYDYVGTEGDMEIYSGAYNSTIIQRHVDGYYIQLLGSGNVEDLKEMAKSINVTKPLKNTPASTQTHSSQTTSSQTQSSSQISIKSGSFYTGSAEEDKTYAYIYVGKEHAGKSLTVQIWYSRDGNTLNHGNMVPVTVHSDGYIEVASADAYHYYPDHATINLYNSAGNLLDSRSVTLSPESGTQRF